MFKDPLHIEWKETDLITFEADLMDATAVLLNESIYVGGSSNRISMYHLDTNQWDCNQIETPQHCFAFTVLSDKLIIAGGMIKQYSPYSTKTTDNVLVWEGEEWREYPKMPSARFGATAVSFELKVIVIGGSEGFKSCNLIEMLDSVNLQWYKCNNLPHPICCAKSVIVGDMLYVLGGYCDGALLEGKYVESKSSKRVYATSLRTLSDYHLDWQRLADTPWCGSAIASLDNHVLAVGGIETDADTICVLRCRKGSAITSTVWEPVASLPIGNLYNSAVFGVDNRIIVFGGGKYSKRNYSSGTIDLSTNMYIGTVRTSLTVPNHSNS